ncbi:MAG: hypothetical protein JEZ03_10440 [Bacteroidales bacterium]|nr:hypothetical protein [Bacteroidales bacterium]
MASSLIFRSAASRFPSADPIISSSAPTPISTPQLIESGVNSRYIPELLGHRSIKTTSICTHIVNDALTTVKSPFDKMMEQSKATRARNGPAP